MTQKTVVLFPGAWGNRANVVDWWMRVLSAFFWAADWTVVVIHYEGKSLEDYAASARRQLREHDIPNGSCAIAYSMGAQILRLVQGENPAQFRKVALIGGLEGFGVRLLPFLRGLKVAFWPMLRAIFSGQMIFDTAQQVRKIFYNVPDSASFDYFVQIGAARDMLAHMHAEPLRVILQLAFPGFRKHCPPLRCEVRALCPEDDFFVARATYPDEVVRRLTVEGTHAWPVNEMDPAVRSELWILQSWFELGLPVSDQPQSDPPPLAA